MAAKKGTKTAKRAKTARPAKSAKKGTVRTAQSPIARGIVERLKKMATELKLPRALDETARRAQAAALGVRDKWIEAVASVHDDHGAETGVSGWDTGEARTAIARRAAFATAIRAGRDFVAQLEDAANAPYARHGKTANDVYASMKTKVRLNKESPLKESLAQLTKLSREIHAEDRRIASAKREAKALAKASKAPRTEG